MNDHHLERLFEQLARHEGYRRFPYRDTVGKLTVAIGRNLDDVGIDRKEAEHLLSNDIQLAITTLRLSYPWFEALDGVRQGALVNMCFNLGANRLRKFVKFLAAMERGDWQLAAIEMLDSRWAAQVGSRAEELAEQVRTGKYVR